MSEWKTIWRANLRGLPFMAACVAIGWAIGVTIALLLMAFLFEPGDGYVCFGIFFALFGVLVGGLASRNLHASTRYALAISMGQTRRGYLLWDTVWRLVECLFGMAVSVLLGVLEALLYTILFPGEEDVLDLMGELLGSGWAIPLLLLGAICLAVLNLVMAAIMTRFGQKGFLMFFVPIWLFSLLINPAIQAAREQTGSLMAGLGGLLLRLGAALSGIGWAVFLLLLVAAAAAASILYLLRAPVRI